jgi:calcyphosin
MDAKQELANVMKLFKNKIMARGARGIVGLQRVFKIMDDDGSRTLSPYEFGKACKDFKMGIPEENFPMLFDAFDTNRDGTLNVDEFLMAIRGEMNPARTAMVEAAFRKIDTDNSGFFGMEDIKDIYKADRHPDVLQGKRTE